jgi:excisionase family DNA binding protein
MGIVGKCGRTTPRNGAIIMQTVTPTIGDIIQHTRELVDEKEAAEILDTAPGTLSVWRSTGRYAIPFIKVGRRVRYRRSDLERWLESRTRTNGATA